MCILKCKTVYMCILKCKIRNCKYVMQKWWKCHEIIYVWLYSKSLLTKYITKLCFRHEGVIKIKCTWSFNNFFDQSKKKVNEQLHEALHLLMMYIRFVREMIHIIQLIWCWMRVSMMELRREHKKCCKYTTKTHAYHS